MSEIKYEKVKNKLKAAIESGEYARGDKLPTESELMQKYGVSRYTIRRAAGELENNHYIYRIQGGGMYVDDWKKSYKRSSNTKVIGVITTHFADYIFPRIISGMDRLLSENGYSLMITNTHNNSKIEKRAIERMLANNVAGLIIEPSQSALPNNNIDVYQRISAADVPTVFVNAHVDGVDFPYLEVNDTQAEQDVTNYLIKMGHQKILGIFQVDDAQGADRLKGFMNAYFMHPEISYLNQTIMYQSSQDMNLIFEKIERVLTSKDRPTAIVCYNDDLAIKLMDLIRSVNLHIPDDISIIGFDDFIMDRYIVPSLTTIEHPKEKMGYDVGNMILKIINGEKVDSIIYPGKLIKRDSVKNLQ